MKKILLITSAFVFLGFASHAFAQGFVPLAPIPGLTQGVTANQAGLANFFNNLYKYLIGIAAVLAVIEIIWGGLEISTQDSVSKQSAGKERITQAILGLVLVLSPVLVFSIINPSILNLSVNLPELDTKSGTSAPAPTTQGAVRAGTTKNATKVGQVIGYGEGYYVAPKPGGYCFQLADSAVANGEKYFCSGDPDGCRLVYNDFNKQSLVLDQCTKY